MGAIISISFFLVSQFILTEDEFICGFKQEFYLVSVSQNIIQDTIRKIEGIKNQKIKDSVWRLIYEDQDEFEVVYKDGKREKVKVKKTCPIKITREPKVNRISGEIIDLIFDIPPGEKIKAKASLGEIVGIKPEGGRIKVSYKRFSKTPYKDIIFLMSSKKDGNGNELIRYYYNKLKIPGKIIFEGKTEPEVQGKIKIGGREIEFLSDEKGRFFVPFYVIPGEYTFRVILKDKFGNQSEQEVRIPEYRFDEPRLSEAIRVGGKILVIGGEFVAGSRVMRLGDTLIARVGGTSSILIPGLGFGKYYITLGEEILIVEKKMIPYKISIYPEKNLLAATGEEKIKLLVRVEDILGNEIELRKLPYFATFSASYGILEIEEEGEYPIFYAERMPEEVRKYDVKIGIEAEIIIDRDGVPKSVFLRSATQISLTAGKPTSIYTELSKDFLKGDGKDEVEIKVKLKDKVGNTVFFDSHILNVSASVGEVKLKEKSDKEIKFAVRYRSESDDIIKIKLEYGELSKTLDIKVVGVRRKK